MISSELAFLTLSDPTKLIGSSKKVFFHRDDVITVYENAINCLPHICNDACLVKKWTILKPAQAIQSKYSYPFQMIILYLVF